MEWIMAIVAVSFGLLLIGFAFMMEPLTKRKPYRPRRRHQGAWD